MNRTIPRQYAKLVELLELEHPAIVTPASLEPLAREAGVVGDIHLVIHRLARRGWLLPAARGCWEFVPGSRAGAYSSNDPWLQLTGYLIRVPQSPVRIALGSALYLLDLVARAPDRGEIALPPRTRPTHALGVYRLTRFRAALPPLIRHRLPIEAPASILVHLAEQPTDARSWEAILEAMPALVAQVEPSALATELKGRNAATRARLGYLLEPYAKHLVLDLAPATGRVTFGPRGPVRRVNTRWRVSDTVLPRAPGKVPE